MKIKFKNKTVAALVAWAVVDIILTLDKIIRAIIENILP